MVGVGDTFSGGWIIKRNEWFITKQVEKKKSAGTMQEDGVLLPRHHLQRPQRKERNSSNRGSTKLGKHHAIGIPKPFRRFGSVR